MKKKELLMIGLMVFSVFFGAGNLIFPPIIGKQAGTSVFTTMFFFSITAIIFPILGVVAVAKSDGLRNLANRVDPIFSIIFTIAAYLAIGPALAMPRAGTLPFEIAISPYIPANVPKGLILFIYTTVFFGVVYWLSLSPNKLLERISKITSPIFLVLILMLFVGTFLKPMGGYMPPEPLYAKNMGLQGFLDGYLTLVVISTGIFAGILLFVVYMMLAHVGASSISKFPNTSNGAEILADVMKYLYGNFGAVLLACMFTVACLNIGVGLTTSLSQYFHSMVKRVPYKVWATIWVIWSYMLANLGLNKIMEYSVPVLLAIYPASLVLIVLALIDKYIKGSSTVYRFAIYPTVVISIIHTLDKINIKIPLASSLIKKLPLQSADLGWLSVAGICFVIGFIISKVTEKNTVDVEVN